MPEDAQVGMPAAEYYKVESDWLIEIDITANRADALSHYGVARDLYAWLKQNGYETSLHRPDCSKFKVDNHNLPIKVTIENTDACRRYACLSITDCEVKESPQWLKDKLNIIGVRPINNIVDITNYIMMAYGQPMHCFDADMVTGRQIIVKDNNERQEIRYTRWRRTYTWTTRPSHLQCRRTNVHSRSFRRKRKRNIREHT